MPVDLSDLLFMRITLNDLREQSTVQALVVQHGMKWPDCSSANFISTQIYCWRDFSMNFFFFSLILIGCLNQSADHVVEWWSLNVFSYQNNIYRKMVKVSPKLRKIQNCFIQIMQLNCFLFFSKWIFNLRALANLLRRLNLAPLYISTTVYSRSHFPLVLW